MPEVARPEQGLDLVSLMTARGNSDAEALGRETGQANEPAKLVAPMLARFMATDRGFIKSRRT